MSFWGLSSLGKEASGQQAQIARQQQQQMMQWLAQAQGYGSVADWLRDQGIDYNTAKMAEGTGFTPADVTATGREIMPGVNEALDTRLQRLLGIRSAYGNLPTAGDTTEQINRIRDEQAGRIGSNYDDLQAEIDRVTGAAGAREAGASGQVVKNIQDTYGGLRSNVGETYGGLRRQGADLYRTLGLESGTAFDTAAKNLEMLKPGGEFQTAQTARAFAPQMASAAGRLRRMGIDPNSPQAASLLGRVETARARGMDDRAAAATEGYVDRSNAVALQKQADRERLARAGFGTEADLAREATGMDVSLGREQGGTFRDELIRSLAAQQGIDYTRAAQTLQNTDTAFQRGQGMSDKRAQDALLARQLGLEDFGNSANLERELNQEELTRLGLLQQQYGMGLQQKQLDLAERNRAAQNITGISQEQYGNMFGAGNMAQGFGQQVAGNWGDVYNREAANAGWGTKLLGGMGVAALKFIPKVGPMLSQIAGGGMSRVYGTGQQGGGGGFNFGNISQIFRRGNRPSAMGSEYDWRPT